MDHELCFAVITKLGELAMRDHYYCEDTWYNCPAYSDEDREPLADAKCSCGADEHNAKVIALIQQYNVGVGAA